MKSKKMQIQFQDVDQSVKSFDESFKDFDFSLSISNTVQTMAKDKFDILNSDILL